MWRNYPFLEKELRLENLKSEISIEQIYEKLTDYYKHVIRMRLLRLGLSLLIMIVLNSVPSESAVSSIDLGSDWLKVAVVNLKPGQTPISIAINEMSKRKTPALVSFQSETRLLGEEAAGITARYPDKVYSHLRDMLGKTYVQVKEFLDAMYLPFDVVEDSRGAVAFRIEDESGNVSLYSVEELLGMILGFAGDLAEFHSKVVVKDAVVSVPAYFGQAERRGLVQAAQMAGINVLSLINEHSGAALQYGIDKDFLMDRGTLCSMIWVRVVLMPHLCISQLTMQRSLGRLYLSINFR